MYARVTPYKMKPGTKETATALLEEMKPSIMALPGLVHFVNVMNDDGSGYVISVIESQEISDANQDKVMAIWGRFAEHLEAMPQPQGFDLIANWSN
ncbi:MAG: hypothetical protein HKP40_03830, partial [Litoreibacter sp.]|nr:hypothetical protein [Litoreibacter sp.]